MKQHSRKCADCGYDFWDALVTCPYCAMTHAFERIRLQIGAAPTEPIKPWELTPYDQILLRQLRICGELSAK